MAQLEINDVIHKRIVLSDRERQILDHPFMQRLRHIRQLGFVSFVYPSATHDRFSHSLGTLHVASLLLRQFLYNESYSALAVILSENEKQFVVNLLRCAALLHDVGHAPFSHTAEKNMPRARLLALPREWLRYPDEERPARHEDYSALFIAALAREPYRLLEENEAWCIASFIHHKKIKPPPMWNTWFSSRVNAPALHALVRALISSDIDADRMDYLLRDAHFAGVTYGNFDLPWLISNLGVVKINDGYRLSISESGIHALEHYLLARYNMYAQVYMHKTVKCFEYYFQKSLQNHEVSYAIPSAIEEYARLQDSTLAESLLEVARHDPLSWAGRLIRREPARRIARIWNSRDEIEKLFAALSKDLAAYRVYPFLHFSQSKFLDLEEVVSDRGGGESESLFGGLATLPIVVVRKQFGKVSIAPLADYSFILKRYHQDIAIGDIYILSDQYEKERDAVDAVVRRYHTMSPSEVILRDEL